MAQPEITRILLEISAQDATIDDVDQMTRQLLEELRETEAESVDLMREGSAPEGTKSADPITTGAIIMAVLPTTLPKLVEVVQAWVMRGAGRTVKFKGKVSGQEIEFEGSAEDLQKVLASLPAAKKTKP